MSNAAPVRTGESSLGRLTDEVEVSVAGVRGREGRLWTGEGWIGGREGGIWAREETGGDR